MTTDLNSLHVSAVLKAIRSIKKPWSNFGGARLHEISVLTGISPMVVDACLARLMKFKQVVGIIEASPKATHVRYYLDIYEHPQKRF